MDCCKQSKTEESGNNWKFIIAVGAILALVILIKIIL